MPAWTTQHIWGQARLHSKVRANLSYPVNPKSVKTTQWDAISKTHIKRLEWWLGLVLLLLYRTRVWFPAPMSGSLQLCVTLNSVSRRILFFSEACSLIRVCRHMHTHIHKHALGENIYNLHTNNRKGLERSLVNVRVSDCLPTSVLSITCWDDDASCPPAEELTGVFH